MASPEERQAKAQEAIASYVEQLVPIFTAINKTLVDFAKMIKESDEAYDEKFAGKGDMCMMVPREVNPVDQSTISLGDAFRTPYEKEGE